MNLDQMLNNIQTTIAPVAPITKTASASASPAALDAAVSAALQSVGQAKTASAPTPTPTSDLEKMAAQEVEMDKQAEINHAYTLGVAMSDGFEAGRRQHEAAAVKVASEGVTAEDLQLIKLARENPQAFLAEVQRGFSDTVGQAKVAEDAEYVDVYNRTVAGIHKLASEHWGVGYATTCEVLKDLAAQQA